MFFSNDRFLTNDFLIGSEVADAESVGHLIDVTAREISVIWNLNYYFVKTIPQNKHSRQKKQNSKVKAPFVKPKRAF